MTIEQILDKLENARSWKEAGVSVEDVYNALCEVEEYRNTSKEGSQSNELTELQEKVERLTETNKQLRAENKQLRNGK